MRFMKFFFCLNLILVIFILTGCQATVTPAPTNTPPAPTGTATEPAPPVEPSATPTLEIPNTLIVCTQDEPQTLYMYGGSSRSMWSVLEAVYDGPFDTRGFSIQPVILEKIPSLADGDAVIRPATLQAGDSVIDVDGNLVALAAGVRLLPSGCSSPTCAVTWDGGSPIAADQLVVTFRLKEGLKWSDGQPLSASDSVFSYSLAVDPATPTSKYLVDRTYGYVASDNRTVEWTGMPGFYEQRFGSFFFLPLPEHALGSKSAADLLSDPQAARAPLGWGPYVIQEWAAGDHITLTKNKNYFRAAEGLPHFDTLVYRFVGQAADSNLSALLAGECDVVDQNMQFLKMIPDLLEREARNTLKTYAGQGPEWEHLDFGIRPAAYDDEYQPGVDRPDFFGDVRARQAFALCIDRQAIINQYLFRRSDLPDGYLPPSHPQFLADLPKYPFDPLKGGQLLDEMGWKDTDDNPATPRQANGVSGIPDGTPFSVTYLTTEAPLRQQVAQAIAGMLNGCGVQVSLEYKDPGSLFSPGPDGPIFGRQFDLTEFSWEAGARPNCLLYSTTQVPSAVNQWIGANISGFTSREFDAACVSAYWARPTDADFAERSRLAQELFAKELPALPLYFYPKIAIARPDLCGLEMDVTARSIFWNIEEFNYGAGCP